MFLRNAWYVAAWDDEVRDIPLGRMILNEPVVLFRQSDGTPVALENRCCHRLLPLDRGSVVGDEIQCGYHGLRYDAQGRCTFVPGKQNIPPQARVRSYPVLEKSRWIWIWMGDPAQADPDEIEDFHWLDDPSWSARGTYLHVEVDYRRIIENLLDQTHLTYVHPTTIGNSANAAEAEVKFESNSKSVRCNRWVMNQPAPPAYQNLCKFAGNVDRWQITEWTPPAFLRLSVGCADANTGARDGSGTNALRMWNLNAVTPETEHSSHYFWAQAQSVDPQDDSLTEYLFQKVQEAFLEDVEIFEAQQTSTALDPSVRQVDLATDEGGIRALRILDRLIRAEQRPAAGAAE